MIVVDVETTGVTPGKHGIVGIGAVDFGTPKNQFYVECRIDETTVVDPYSLVVNGFTEAQIRDPKKPTQVEAVTQFLKWTQPIKDKTIGGHNTLFDVGMLRVAFKAAGLEASLLFNSVDMHNILYATLLRTGQPVYINRYGFFSARANHTYEFVGLPKEPEPHNALTGAKMEAEAMSRLIYGKSLLAEFKKYKVPEYL